MAPNEKVLSRGPFHPFRKERNEMLCYVLPIRVWRVALKSGGRLSMRPATWHYVLMAKPGSRQFWWERPFVDRPYTKHSSTVAAVESLWFCGLMILRHASNERKARSELREREGHFAVDIKEEVLANKYIDAFSKQEETEGIIPWLNQDGSKKAALSSIPILENECKCMADYYIRLPIAWQTPHGEMACTHVFFLLLEWESGEGS